VKTRLTTALICVNIAVAEKPHTGEAYHACAPVFIGMHCTTKVGARFDAGGIILTRIACTFIDVVSTGVSSKTGHAYAQECISSDGNISSSLVGFGALSTIPTRVADTLDNIHVAHAASKAFGTFTSECTQSNRCVGVIVGCRITAHCVVFAREADTLVNV
jgi:hypothetical protein